MLLAAVTSQAQRIDRYDRGGRLNELDRSIQIKVDRLQRMISRGELENLRPREKLDLDETLSVAVRMLRDENVGPIRRRQGGSAIVNFSVDKKIVLKIGQNGIIKQDGWTFSDGDRRTRILSSSISPNSSFDIIRNPSFTFRSNLGSRIGYEVSSELELNSAEAYLVLTCKDPGDSDATAEVEISWQ